MSTSTSQLFAPIKVGAHILQHRVVLAPLTRYRGTKKDHVPINPLMKTYYSQRSSRPGSLVITEATFISPQAGGYDNVPGIWSDAQIAAWKEITDAVHANGSYIYLQMWALGRTATPSVLKEDGFKLVAPSPIPIGEKYETPRALTIPEIHDYVQQYAKAAKNAVEGAGFDGVEVHCANGYLLDQFLQDVSNHRTDEYGGSVEGRSKFALQVVDAVVKAVGQERTAIRISPWGTYQNMKMKDPKPQFSHFIGSVGAAYPNISYVHAVEPDTPSEVESNDFIRNIWAPRPLITCGNYTRETAIERADTKGDLIAFGKHYISNPDLATRLQKNIPLAPFIVKTFYTPGDVEGTEVGYIDYPFAESESAEVQARPSNLN
ncbi:hypothetical protein BDZ97DRAFT_1737829 [Flammula alnicola]|nr:hypothetical protein BDZ97DRAFT_1737829 [Flammula alnicola]